jgi:hypothetical protein
MVKMRILCCNSIHIVHTLGEFWDGEKFDVNPDHTRCLIRMLPRLENNQINYIFEHFELLLLENLNIIFGCDGLDPYDARVFTRRKTYNLLFQKGLQIKGLKEYIETNIIKLIEGEHRMWGNEPWIIRLLKQLKIRIEPEKFKYVRSLDFTLPFFDNNSLYSFKEKIKLINYIKHKYYYDPSGSLRFEKRIMLIVVRELQHRYRRCKIEKVKKFMVSNCVIKNLSSLILGYI